MHQMQSGAKKEDFYFDFLSTEGVTLHPTKLERFSYTLYTQTKPTETSAVTKMHHKASLGSFKKSIFQGSSVIPPWKYWKKVAYLQFQF